MYNVKNAIYDLLSQKNQNKKKVDEHKKKMAQKNRASEKYIWAGVSVGETYISRQDR